MAELADAHGSGSNGQLGILISQSIDFTRVTPKRDFEINENFLFSSNKYAEVVQQQFHTRLWRNWQTRMVQVHVKAISWRFKSS